MVSWAALPNPVRWLRQHSMAADALLGVLLAAISVGFHLSGETGGALDEATDPTWWTVLLVVAATLPVAMRRVRPIQVVLVVTGAQIVSELADVAGAGFSGVLVAVYSLGAHTEGPARRTTAAVVGTSLGLLLVTGYLEEEVGFGDVLSSAVILVATYVLGDNLQRRRQAAADLAERADRAERERDLLAQRRVAAERTRIARELHDVVAHSVSVMVIQAAAARRTLESDPARAQNTLAEVEETGRRAMTELRRVLGVLRSEPDESGRTPQPSLADLEDLAAENDDLPVHVRVEGRVADLAPGVSLAAYRVVQESLTNVRRHAGPVSKVDVVVQRCDGELSVLVEDDGRGAAADPADPGYGIVGMRERVGATDGDLTAGPRPGGGWRVRARFPVRAT